MIVSRTEPITKDTLDDAGSMSLHTLPYDLLLNVAQYLDLCDVHAVQLTCRSLHDFATTRPVYRNFANDLLRRCRALPLKGFKRLSDLTTDQLIQSVNKATHYERAWRVRAPRPITVDGKHMDFSSQGTGVNTNWYRVVSAPPKEEVDWLSPITSSYTLCATKSGKVVCWDVQSDVCLAEWNPGERWELWKCRVEFEERTVFFTMAKVISGSYDDDRVMEFVLMQLHFPEGPSVSHTVAVANGTKASLPPTPIFSRVTEFKTTGVVMNVFLLDPPERLLSAFVWVSSSNTIGLYVLLDWGKREYVFIDTGIACLLSSNWSCILFEENIVIHSEESDAAFQYFYPMSLLQTYRRNQTGVPTIAARVPPRQTLSKKFIFPLTMPDSEASTPDPPSTPTTTTTNIDGSSVNGTDQASSIGSSAALSPVFSVPTSIPAMNINPFPFPPWYPESAHFVRQWWPTLPGLPRLSCTVVLLAAHDQDTHRTRFVLAQHYFKVPMTDAWHGSGEVIEDEPTSLQDQDGSMDGSETEPEKDSDADDDPLMRLWYVSTPFEVVCVLDGTEEDEDGMVGERPRPLVAVDFGHAVWIEYMDHEDERATTSPREGEAKWLRFVTFPSVNEDLSVGGDGDEREGTVRTLDVPDELDLDTVETINIDQSQGAVILSVKEGKIFILMYS